MPTILAQWAGEMDAAAHPVTGQVLLAGQLQEDGVSKVKLGEITLDHLGRLADPAGAVDADHERIELSAWRFAVQFDGDEGLRPLDPGYGSNPVQVPVVHLAKIIDGERVAPTTQMSATPMF